MDIFDLADKIKQAPVVEPVLPGSPPDPVQPTTDPATDDATKAYAERLKADRAKIQDEVKLETAKSFGYNSWAEMQTANEQKIIDESGLEPDKVKPLIEKLVEQHPSVVAAKNLQAENEALVLKKEETDALFELNRKFKTSYKELSEVDEAVRALYKKGVPLDKAYAAEHLDEIVKSQAPSNPSKDHLQPVGKPGEAHLPRTVTPQELAMFRKFNPRASAEEISAFIAKQTKK